MAKARILAPWVGREEKSATYHVVSRVVERRRHFGKVEKEQFVELMRIYEAFCGVKVLSFSVMSNHFHILVEVSPRPDGGISDEEILKRLSLIQKPDRVAEVRKLFESYQVGEITEKGKEAHEALREKYLSRMWDLGQFMKSLKQRFSRWFNKEHERKGTLWEERYNSSLVEDGYASLVISAYIDLNSVRAGMVDDPKDYRWSSYAEAVAGGQLARSGIARVLKNKDSARLVRTAKKELEQELKQLEGYEWRSIAGRYRVFLFEEGAAPGQGKQARQVQGLKRSGSKGFSKKKIAEEKAREGQLSVVSKLHCRTRSLIDGAVLGSRGFVEAVIHQLNEQKYWSNPRKTGGTRLKISSGGVDGATHRKKIDEDKKNEMGNQIVNSGSGKVAGVFADECVKNDSPVEELWSLRHLKKE